MMGVIDLLTVRGSSIEIVDWKTGVYKAADEQQLRIYTRMVSEIMAVPPRNIVATLCYLRDPRKIQRHVPFTSATAIDHHIVHNVIEPIRDLQFVPKRGKACARCEYRHLCEAW
jgi:MoaA/NifB/PqqE/SkfB family radical SAM enzyme